MIISFIICTYNRDRYIYECLSRLANNSISVGWELVVINNNSTDNTAAECTRFRQEFPYIDYHYFVEHQQGLSYARNRGIQEAKGDWFVFLDDDAMVGTDYISNLQKHLSAHQDAGAFGGQITPFFEVERPEWLSRWSMVFVSAIDMGQAVRLFRKNTYPIGANMGISRAAIETAGMFNTALGRTKNSLLGGEEKDIFSRIRQAGFKIYYFPQIEVQHCIPPHRTTNEFISRLGYGVGVSERRRTLSEGKTTYIKRLLSELIKWVGTLVIRGWYLAKGENAKGNILILFRKQVTKGLFICEKIG